MAPCWEGDGSVPLELSRRQLGKGGSALIPLPDRRVALDQQMNVLKEQLGQRLAHLLEQQPDVVGRHDEIVARLVDIRQAWHAMRHQALRVGRALLRIRREAPPAYDAIVREPGILPFGENVAKKLRL